MRKIDALLSVFGTLLLVATMLIVAALPAHPSEGEPWHGYMLVQEATDGVSLYELEKTFAEQPECNSVVMMQYMSATVQGARVLDYWCSTSDGDQTIKELKQKFLEEPA